MVLNYIWIFFFLCAFVMATARMLAWGETHVFTDMMNAMFASSKDGFEISLGLTGVLAFWLGILKIGERAGVISGFSRLMAPLFTKIFPEIPPKHPAMGAIFMNLSANMLGLDNAATPFGLKAMREMQSLNSRKDTASDPMIMFLVLNTSGMTLIPVSIMVYRAQQGASNPSDVFIPILLATYFSTMVGFVLVALRQRINLLQKTVVAYVAGITAAVAGMIWYFSTLPEDKLMATSALMAAFVLTAVVVTFVTAGAWKKINVYDAFIEGAKEGFTVAVGIIPYLIAILVAVGLFRASGAMDLLACGLTALFAPLGVDTRFVDALPTALMKPLSGSGARGLMVDAMKTFGADSFVGRLVCVMQGTTDTTFYILAVYFGSVGIRNVRYALTAGLLADLAGIIASILIAYMFF